ncbi:MAG: uracil-DNA glycosylase [bacterium]|nr:uracil-DNA glycosylase [bacterium]
MKNSTRLNRLQKQFELDDILPLVGQSNGVFGEGSPEASILLIGEAPGKKEDELRRPFVGRSGTMLTHWLSGIGIERSDVYITNIVKRRPPENRDPTLKEIEAYRPYLEKQLEIIRPRVVVPIGRFAMNFFLPDVRISNAQGKIFWCDKRIIMPVFHPAAAMRSARVKTEAIASFAKLQKVIEDYDQVYALAKDYKDLTEITAYAYGPVD